MSRFSVLYDANILYPATLRDSFLRLALSGLFQAYWTKDINDEWITALLRNEGDKFTREQLEFVRGLMNRHVPHAIITGYTHLIAGLHLPDRDDRHVLAAAIKQGVDAIVTFNLKDFPASEVGKYDIESSIPTISFLHSLSYPPQKYVRYSKSNVKV